jgi:hypothetical protein
MSLLHIPHPAGGKKPQRVMPLGPMPELPKPRTPEQKRADDLARWALYREVNREARNQRMREWRAAKKRKAA